MKNKQKYYPRQTLIAFLLVLFAMPLGHALMILMEKFMGEGAMHIAGFMMGFVGLILVIIGVFVKGDTRQTLWGFIGGLLFWTGWVEFLFLYYARRYGVQPEIENGEIVTKPEYLIMPASFGLWMMVMTMYVFSTRNGCDFITWIQKVVFRTKRKVIAAQPMTRHTSIVTFMELNMMLWGALPVADVLLRQAFPRRPPSRYVPRRSGMPHRLVLYIASPTASCLMGCKHPHGNRNGCRVLGTCGSAWSP